jgi:hypothetical protein
MRPPVVTAFPTLDGVAQAPGGPQEDTAGGWSTARPLGGADAAGRDLVDGLRTIVSPAVLGRGKRLFGGGAAPRTWETVSSATTSTGAVMTTQRRVGEVTTGSDALEDAA